MMVPSIFKNRINDRRVMVSREPVEYVTGSLHFEF